MRKIIIAPTLSLGLLTTWAVHAAGMSFGGPEIKNKGAIAMEQVLGDSAASTEAGVHRKAKRLIIISSYMP